METRIKELNYRHNESCRPKAGEMLDQRYPLPTFSIKLDSKGQFLQTHTAEEDFEDKNLTKS